MTELDKIKEIVKSRDPIFFPKISTISSFESTNQEDLLEIAELLNVELIEKGLSELSLPNSYGKELENLIEFCGNWRD